MPTADVPATPVTERFESEVIEAEPIAPVPAIPVTGTLASPSSVTTPIEPVALNPTFVSKVLPIADVAATPVTC